MICPYNRKQEKQVLQVTNEYDEDGKADNTQQITSWTYTMMECPQEGCAVWRDGRCRYAAVSLENC